MRNRRGARLLVAHMGDAHILTGRARIIDTPRARGDGKSGYLPYIDGLRAVAVLAVVFYHLDAAWLPGGFTGVDIFFVISGFVVSASVDRLERLGALASLFRFYARRLRRIAPALIACLLVTCGASALFIPQAWLSDTSQHTGLMAFAGMSNWVLARTGNDYFSPKVDFNPYTHTWSLGVEEQFYLLFPLMFMAWMAGGRKRALSVALFGMGLIASLGWAVHLGHAVGREIEAFYLTTSRFWQLAAGVLLYQALAFAGRATAVEVESSRHDARWRDLGCVLAVAALVAGLVFARAGRSPWPDGTWPVVGTLGILGLVHGRQNGWLGRLLSLPPVVWIGRVSYSIYLWHWPVFVLFRWTIGLESAWTRLAALALTFAFAGASYRFVERPLRRAPALVRMPDWRFVTAAAIVVAGCGFTYQRVTRHANQYSLSTVSRHVDVWFPSADPIAVAGCEVQQDSRAAGGDIVAWNFSRGGCAESKPAEATMRVFVAGDSHAAGYVEMLQRFVLASGHPVTLYAEGGCPIVSLRPGRERVAQCRSYARQVYADLAANAHPGDVLFLPALRLPRMTEQWALLDEQRALAGVFGVRATKWRHRAESVAIAQLRPLAGRGIHVVFEAPKPLFRAPAYRCSDWFNRSNPICARGLSIDRAFLLRYRRPTLESLQRIASRLPGASVWDPFPVLCPGTTCTAIRDGRPLFFDGDHLSGHGNRMLVASFSDYIDTKLARPMRQSLAKPKIMGAGSVTPGRNPGSTRAAARPAQG